MPNMGKLPGDINSDTINKREAIQIFKFKKKQFFCSFNCEGSPSMPFKEAMEKAKKDVIDPAKGFLVGEDGNYKKHITDEKDFNKFIKALGDKVGHYSGYKINKSEEINLSKSNVKSRTL
jgi:hypothetical protein